MNIGLQLERAVRRFAEHDAACQSRGVARLPLNARLSPRELHFVRTSPSSWTAA